MRRENVAAAHIFGCGNIAKFGLYLYVNSQYIRGNKRRKLTMNENEMKAINTIRVLSAEAIEKAKSGHPGLPLGAAPMGFTLWEKHLKHNPSNPSFQNRDRFVLSAGHGSMLLYSLLHLFGYDVTMSDLQNFRQLQSRTPGHPEFGRTAGVETTTGPLGQGVACGVGMAIAESYLAAKFNRPNYNVVDHFTYVLTGDGCMQEGIEYEAASLAGTLKLGKLIVLYDKNGITIEGSTDTAFTEDVGKRHEAQGWQVLGVNDGNDIDAIDAALVLAKQEKEKPTLIIVNTQIGYGSPLAGSAACHGAPLGESNVKKLRQALRYTAKPFEVADDVKEYMTAVRGGLAKYEDDWKKIMRGYKKAFPELAEEYENWMKGKIADLEDNKDLFTFDGKAQATRTSSAIVLGKLAKLIPNLVGGSADLGPSNKSAMPEREYFSPENRTGSNFHFGIREHAMAAIVNGMYLHGGLKTYCSTFFVFSDYMKHAMRLAALMEIPVAYILTHDSIGVGEDGSTHQPVEQLVGLRSIPNMKVFRPADAKETAAGWVVAMTGKTPTALILSRQDLPQFKNSGIEAMKGGYVLSESGKEVPDVILMASGSEVQLAMEAQKRLKEQEIEARVVSMPCIELFEKQSAKYRESVLPSSVRARVAVEAGSHYSWDKYVGLDGTTVTMDTFGASAPSEKLFEIYGFSVDNVVDKAVKTVKLNRKIAAAEAKQQQA